MTESTFPWGKCYLGAVPLMAVLLMAGCATRAEIQIRPEPHPAEALAAAGMTEPKFPFPLEPPYQGPSVGADSATIKGCELRRLLLVLPVDIKAFVLSIDGKRVMAGMAGWDSEVKVDPGLRTVTIAFDNNGVFLAQTDLQLDAIPGAHYMVQFKFGKTSTFGAADIDFSIIDAATGKTVTSPVAAFPLSVDLEVVQAMDEYYGLPPYAEPDGAQAAHPPLVQGETLPRAAGPKYAYTEQKDSASVGVGQTLNGFLRSPYAGNSVVSIDQVDGFVVGFPSVSFLGLFPPDPQSRIWDKAGKVWMPPGKHALALTFSQNTPDAAGGTFSFTGSYTVSAEFAANHQYRFTASAYGDLCYVALWDETGGLATRSSAGYWWFRGQQTYTPPDDTSSPSVHIHTDKKRK